MSLSIRRLHEPHAQLDKPHVSVIAEYRHVLVGAGDFEHLPRKRARTGRNVHAVRIGHEIGYRFSLEFVFEPAGHFFGGIVDGIDQPVRRHGHDRIGCLLEDDPVLALQGGVGGTRATAAPAAFALMLFYRTFSSDTHLKTPPLFPSPPQAAFRAAAVRILLCPAAAASPR